MPAWRLMLGNALLALMTAIAPPCNASAQVTTGTPGAPDTVIFPDSRQLPMPTAPCSGEILPSARDNTPG